MLRIISQLYCLLSFFYSTHLVKCTFIVSKFIWWNFCQVTYYYCISWTKLCLTGPFVLSWGPQGDSRDVDIEYIVCTCIMFTSINKLSTLFDSSLWQMAGHSGSAKILLHNTARHYNLYRRVKCSLVRIFFVLQGRGIMFLCNFTVVSSQVKLWYDVGSFPPQ